MKMPTIRRVHFHGSFKDKYYNEVLEVGADSMYALCNILFEEVFPDLLNEKHLSIAFEDSKGNVTELFDPEQELDPDHKDIHIMPNPDGAYGEIIAAIVIAIVAIGVALLLAPKIDNLTVTASGANWETPENVVGQGGIIPVVLGTRLVGSRVASYGIDSTVYQGRAEDNVS